MQRLRICFVVTELLGLERNGGIGTAITHMSLILAARGHEVEVLHCGHRHEVHEPWASRYRRAGVTIRIVDRPETVEPRGVQPSWCVYHDLKVRPPDVAIFQDWRGLGAMSMLAKQAGAAFARTKLIHHVHGPTDWLDQANGTVTMDAEQAVVGAMERISAELADVVVGPSQHLIEWMLERGWELPAQRHVIPYFTAGHVEDLARPLAADRPPGPLTELVFFGRLEARKGVRVLTGALNRLGPSVLQRLDVTFLGRSTGGFSPPDVRWTIDDAVEAALGELRFIDDLDQPAAREYLQQPGRLALIPSLLDNSPNVVYECIEDRVSFLASASGGTGELVHETDRPTTLFEPTPAALAERLRPFVEARTLPPPARPAFDGPSALAAWQKVLTPPRVEVAPPERQLVSAIVPTHDRPDDLRRAVRSLAEQEYEHLEIVVVDDGSTTEAARAVLDRLSRDAAGRPVTVVRQPNRYLGAARNAGVRAARGDLLIFLDDDDLAAPTYVRVMATAATAASADAVVCAFEMIDASAGGAPHPRDTTGVWAFLGGPLSIGSMVNVLGGAGLLVRRAAFEKVGGFHEQAGVGHEDWQFLAKIAVAGGRIAAIPEALYRYRYRDGTMIRTTSPYANAEVVNAVYRELLPDELASWPRMLRGLHEQLAATSWQLDALHGDVFELRAELDRRLRYIALLERRGGPS